MAQQADLDLARRWCDALTGRDPSSVEGALDQASLMHVPGQSGLAGDYQGGEAIVGVVTRMAELTNGTLRTDPSQVLVTNDRSVVLVGRTNGTHLGRHLDTQVLYAVSLRESKVRDLWVFHPNQELVDAFWAA